MANCGGMESSSDNRRADGIAVHTAMLICSVYPLIEVDYLAAKFIAARNIFVAVFNNFASVLD